MCKLSTSAALIHLKEIRFISHTEESLVTLHQFGPPQASEFIFCMESQNLPSPLILENRDLSQLYLLFIF